MIHYPIGIYGLCKLECLLMLMFISRHNISLKGENRHCHFLLEKWFVFLVIDGHGGDLASQECMCSFRDILVDALQNEPLMYQAIRNTFFSSFGNLQKKSYTREYVDSGCSKSRSLHVLLFKCR